MASPRGRALATRLAMSFVAVAILAVAIGTALAVVLSRHDISVMVDQRRSDLTRSLLVDAASTYNTGQPGWSDADLRPALDLASQSGTDVAVLDATGTSVASTIANPSQISSANRTPIVIKGARVGTLVIRFNQRGLVASADNLRRSLVTAVIGAAGIAALLALVSGLVVARRLTRPVERLTLAAGSMASGDRAVRVGRLDHSPNELQQLGAAFDRMADSLMREEKLRRGVVADVAHELRTPIAVLQANTEALLDGVIDHTPTQTMSLHEEVVRLAVMVDDLQALASAEAAALDLRLAPCDLAAIVDEAVRALSVQAAAADLTVTASLAAATVSGDRSRLHQIVTNILSNAIKFTPAGGRVTAAVAVAGRHAVLEVIDTGTGIPTADRARVFERFWRGDGAQGIAGSGIGLAVVAELVAAHHGTIEIAGEPGAGAVVVVRIPLAEPSAAAG